MSHGVESLDKKDRDVGIAKYSFKKKLLLEYMKSNSRRSWSAKKGRALRIA